LKEVKLISFTLVYVFMDTIIYNRLGDRVLNPYLVEEKTKMIDIYTDGGCLDGIGSWAYCGPDVTPSSGVMQKATSNRAEIMACIQALNDHPDVDVRINSDSQYVVKTMTENWKRNKNIDLWDMLEDLCVNRKVEWNWVRGHNGDYWNEMADALATNARDGKAPLKPVERVKQWVGELHPIEQNEVLEWLQELTSRV